MTTLKILRASCLFFASSLLFRLDFAIGLSIYFMLNKISLPYTFNPPKIRESSLKIGKKFEGHA